MEILKKPRLPRLLLTPGTLLIYYGEEIGMQGCKPDEDIRLLMPELSQCRVYNRHAYALHDYHRSMVEQNEDPDSLLNHYRSLIKLRGENPVLSNGEIVLLDTDNPGSAVLKPADQKFLYCQLKEAPI
jgi:glycosidase